MRIGVLALQGAFLEHQEKLQQLGVEALRFRQQKDLEQSCQGVILPGRRKYCNRKTADRTGYDGAVAAKNFCLAFSIWNLRRPVAAG